MISVCLTHLGVETTDCIQAANRVRRYCANSPPLRVQGLQNRPEPSQSRPKKAQSRPESGQSRTQSAQNRPIQSEVDPNRTEQASQNRIYIFNLKWWTLNSKWWIVYSKWCRFWLEFQPASRATAPHCSFPYHGDDVVKVRNAINDWLEMPLMTGGHG